MGFGAIVQYHYDDGKKFQFLQKPVILISSVPKTIAKIIKKKVYMEMLFHQLMMKFIKI